MNSVDYDSSEVILSRDELYRQVWQEPLTKLAQLYGLSDVGLAKVCDRFDIPRPPMGYWAKRSHGHKVKTSPLPKLDDDSLQEIRFFRHNFDSSPANSEPGNDKIVVTVLERLTQPHPLVAKSKSQISNKTAGENGLVQTSSGSLDISVSSKMVGRSLRILDALIKKWEELGGNVSAKVKRDCAVTIFKYGDDTIAVELFEETKRYERSPQEHSYWKEWTYKPTGRLVLNIPSCGDGLRKRWADGKKQRLEEVLG